MTSEGTAPETLAPDGVAVDDGAAPDASGAPPPFPVERSEADIARYVAWFHELDAWTEYWDVYHPESRGRFYFGDGQGEPGLLTPFMPRAAYPPPWTAWSQWALGIGSREAFEAAVDAPGVAEAVLEVDDLVARLFARHFGDAEDPTVQGHYLDATLRFALDALPPALERDARIPPGDWRKPTAGRHTLDGDLMWFAWAMHTDAADVLRGGVTNASGRARRALTMAGVAAGCPANFVFRGHRRTRGVYRADGDTLAQLRRRGLGWAHDFDAASVEVSALYRIREWGEPA
jgi:hypothetical protein